MTESLLDQLPLWAFFALCCLVTLGAMEAGAKLGAWCYHRAEHEQETVVGSVVASVLGLLAFMLAFNFGGAANRFDTRKALLLQEVNAIGTAYLRAGLLREPHKTQTRELLREYVDLRADLARTLLQPNGLRSIAARSEALHEKLWAHAAAIAAGDRPSPIDALFVESLNEMFDLHTKRFVVATQYRIPSIVWQVLGFVTVLAMAAVGFQFGLSGGRSLVAFLALAFAFSAILLLNANLDRPSRGWLNVSQQPMIDLQRSLRGQAPRRALLQRSPVSRSALAKPEMGR